MLKLRFYTLGLLMFFCQIICGQDVGIVIPFQLTKSNNISIQAILNEKDTVDLMFHTAASSLTLTEDAVLKTQSLFFNSNTEGIQSWGGGENSARLSEKNVLQIGGMKWEGVSIWENKYSGPQTDGKFGVDLFENKVIQLDFEKKTMTITATLPSNIQKYEKLQLLFENDMMFVEASSKIGQSSLKNKFLIHSGYAGGVLLDDQFVSEHQIGEKLKIIGEKELKDSYGNIIKTKKAILPMLKIGNATLSNVPVGFFDGAIGMQTMSILGGDVLKRFNIIIDSKRAYIYLKLNKLKSVKYLDVEPTPKSRKKR